MPSLADKIKFAEQRITAKEGHAFSLEGRDWVRSEFWLPADGFKLWRRPREEYESIRTGQYVNGKTGEIQDFHPGINQPGSEGAWRPVVEKVSGSDCCVSCADHLGEIVEHPVDNPTHACVCGGLKAEPIVVTVINLQRQDGKTFSSMAYALATICRNKNKSVAGLWASEDQGTAIFNENYREAILRSPQLRENCEVSGTPPTIWVPRTHSRFEVLAASARSATGRTRTHVLIDEARDIDARLVMALIPSIFAMHGIECPSGQVQLTEEQAVTAPPTCTVCDQRLTPWYGRIIITSSAGILDGSEHDWLSELIDELEKNPHPNYHVFSSDKTLNPRKSQVIMGAISDVFGRLESTRHYAESEIGNRWTRKGADVVTKAELKRVTDDTLRNTTAATDAPCVGFLDTSRVGEKTSLVILACDAQHSEEPMWTYLSQARLDYWIPEQQPNRVIDDQVVYAHLCQIMPLFTGLRALRVDTRGSQWSLQLLEQIRKSRTPWGRHVGAWKEERYANHDAGWGFLQERILKKTIRLQPDKMQLNEFLGIMVKVPSSGGPPRVVDRDRHKSHMDITESLACCCYLAQQEQTRPQLGMAALLKRRDARELLGSTRSGTTPRGYQRGDRDRDLDRVGGSSFDGAKDF